MKKILFVIGVLVISLVFSMTVNAECSETLKVKAQKVDSEIKLVDKRFNGKKRKMFEVKVNNLASDMKATIDVCEFNTLHFSNDKNVGYVDTMFESTCGTEIIVTSLSKECLNEQLLVKQITLPQYNKYSEKPICKKYNDYKYCKKYYYKYVDLNLVKQKVAALEKADPKAAKENTTIFSKTIKNMNLKEILIGIVIVLGVVAIIIIILNIITYYKKTKK